MILAFDTATAVLSVALQKEDTIYHKKDQRPFGHAEKLMPTINQLFEDAGASIDELTTVLVSLGPGSFTGIRIGIATALGLQSALGVKVYGISSLDARLPEVETGIRMAIIDARRERVYAKVRGYYHMKEENLPFRELLERLEDYDGPVEIHAEEKGVFFDRAKEVLGDRLVWDDTTNYALGMLKAYHRDQYYKEIEPMYLRMTQAEAEKRGIQLD